MAPDVESALTADRSLRWRRAVGRLFEAGLIGATLVGVVALGVLFALIGTDAIGPFAAEPAWYLVLVATLVVPLTAYTLYARRHPAIARVNALAFVVVVGSLAATLALYVVAMAFEPATIAVVVVATTLPPAVVFAYDRATGGGQLTGPAMTVATVVGAILGLALAGPLGETLAVLATWVLFVPVVTVPAAAGIGAVAVRRFDRRAGSIAAVAVLGATGLTVGAAFALGVDPGLAVVLVGGAGGPIGLFAADTLVHRREGRVGLLGPILFAGGLAGTVFVERAVGLTGPDTWLTPTLLLESWSTTSPEQAGIYPQLVGSIVIIAVMTVLAFPVGVGAAIFLEEYAPSAGPIGVLASVLDVNISNLAGVPSVVYGLLGLAVFRNVFGLPNGLVIAAAATLGLLVLPIVIVSAQEALRSVPDEFRQGAFGLGASRWQTVRNVVLPEALPGILTGTILALGRAIGETAPLVMIGVATTAYTPPSGLFDQASALPLQIFAAKANAIPAYRTGVVAATALVLLGLMLLMNGIAIVLRNRYQRD
ncbi:MAG: phosphate ABC transporter permease PstA [Halococcoides sp.]